MNELIKYVLLLLGLASIANGVLKMYSTDLVSLLKNVITHSEKLVAGRRVSWGDFLVIGSKDILLGAFALFFAYLMHTGKLVL